MCVAFMRFRARIVQSVHNTHGLENAVISEDMLWDLLGTHWTMPLQVVLSKDVVVEPLLSMATSMFLLYDCTRQVAYLKFSAVVDL